MFSEEEQKILDSAMEILASKLKRGEAIYNSTIAENLCNLEIGSSERENFGVLYLSNSHHLIKSEILFQGTIDGASVWPREIVKNALINNAAAIIIYHNHPSGTLSPSQADRLITQEIQKAVKLVDIRLLDHLIVSHGKSYSFKQADLL